MSKNKKKSSKWLKFAAFPNVKDCTGSRALSSVPDFSAPASRLARSAASATVSFADSCQSFFAISLSC